MKTVLLVLLLGLQQSGASKLMHPHRNADNADTAETQPEAGEALALPEDAENEQTEESLVASSDDTVMLQEEMQDDLQQSTGAMAMLAEAERLSAESRHRSLRTIEARMHAAAGEDGILVVSSLSAERNPCEGVGYLSDTFVHLNHKEATFVCIPCSSACKGLCFGPGVEGCAELAEPSTKSRRPPATLLLEEGNRPFSHSFHEAFLQHSAVTTGINVSDVLTDEVLACIADGTCSVSTLGLTESDGPLQYNGTTAVITVMNAEGADTVDISQFPAGLQRAWDAAVKRVGLIPYLREDIDSDDEPQEVPVADEEKDDGVPPDTSQKALPSRNQQLQPQGTS